MARRASMHSSGSTYHRESCIRFASWWLLVHGHIITVSASLLRLLGASDVPYYTSKTVTDEEEEELYHSNFSHLTPKQVKAFISKGKRITYSDGTLLTRANEPCHNLYFILSGTNIMTNTDGKLTS